MNRIDETTRENSGAAGKISGRMLILFFVLAFLITWLCLSPTLLVPETGFRLPLIILGAFGPFVASMIVIRMSGGRGSVLPWLKEIFDPRGSTAWIFVAVFLLPIIFGGLHYSLYLILGGRQDFSEAWPWYGYPIALLLTALLTGGNEEPGWRGFALPALARRFHPVTATLILGVVHSAWHLPLMGRYETSFHVYLFNLTGLTFIINWLYFKSNRCVIPAMLFHASTNVMGRYLPTPIDVLGGLGTFMVLRGSVYWIMALVLLIATRGRLGYEKDR
jgi:membrane protease YdiL (CAAX protease family)